MQKQIQYQTVSKLNSGISPILKFNSGINKAPNLIYLKEFTSIESKISILLQNYILGVMLVEKY